ncbi:MAG: CDC27 family protein [Campylobacteraceae bacterium]|jgi:tetratricopeptide (TPR) repeat protein|nr:CDC27 family protein [Campylobacteraceae bacterium]
MLKPEEITTLEERWQEYKNKIIFRRLVTIFLILLFVASVILLFLVLKESNSTKMDNNTAVHNETNQSVATDTPIVDTTTTTAVIDDPEETNTTTTAAVINNQTQTVKTTQTTTTNVSSKNSTAVDDSSKKVNNTASEQQLPKMQDIIKPPVENKIFIETNDIQNIEELIKKFESSNNVIFATMICEEYFDRKNYKKSLEWALRANEVDSQNELSWIMFAKSQVKLGKIDDAIRALEIFTNYDKSATSAANLLKNIRSGEYR